MAQKKAEVIEPETFNTNDTTREQYEIRVIENVPADEVDQLLIEEQQTNPRFLKAEKLPEGDGEYTVVLCYRRG